VCTFRASRITRRIVDPESRLFSHLHANPRAVTVTGAYRECVAKWDTVSQSDTMEQE